MKVQDLDIQTFDTIANTLADEPQFNVVGITISNPIKRLAERLKSAFARVLRLLGIFRLPDNLNDLSIGCLLEIVSSDLKPSEIVAKVVKDLNLPKVTKTEHIIYLYYFIKHEAKKITDILNTAQFQPSSNTNVAEWTRACEEYKISPVLSMIDRIAQRNNITWSSAEKIKWSEVYAQLMIDARSSRYEELVNNKYQQQLKHK